MTLSSLDPLLDVLGSLLAVSVLGISAFGLGRPLLRTLQVAEDDPLAECVWSLTLGLAVAGSLFLLAASVGYLGAIVVGVVSLCGGLWAVGEFACIYLGYASGRVLPVGRPLDAAPAAPPGTRLALALAGVVLVASFVAALAPPTSSEALSRSLTIPQSGLLNHAGSGEHGQTIATPNMAQMWFLWALALDGPVAANLLQTGLGLLVALATVLLARPLLGGPAAVAAGALVLLCPGVNQQMSAPLEDLALALATTLALVVVSQVVLQLESGRWPLAAGIMLGVAIAVHPAGQTLAIVVAGLWAWACWSQRQTRQDLPRAAARLALAAALTAGPWMAWMAMAAGAGLATDGAARQSLRSALAQVGPVLILPLAGLVFARRLRGLNLLLAVMAGYALLAALDPRLGRWWSPIVPPASVAAVWIGREMIRLPLWARVPVTCAWGLVALAAPWACCEKACDALPTVAGPTVAGLCEAGVLTSSSEVEDPGYRPDSSRPL